MQSVPHRCPVCRGKGRVKIGFYLDDPQQAVCRSCNATGILWGWDYAPPVTYAAGWTRATCGGWVVAGTPHQCPTRWTWPWPTVSYWGDPASSQQFTWTLNTGTSELPPPLPQ